jgi:Uma2 family endonuclease
LVVVSQPKHLLTAKEYLDLERLAEIKHEFVDGEMVARSGGSPAHARIILRVSSLLDRALEGKTCAAFSSDLRVAVKADRLITYPDVSVVCPPLEYFDEKRDTITNPRLVVEVLSPSTSTYDRGAKLYLYRTAPSIEEYLLIDPAPVDIEHGRRLESGHWDVRLVSERDATLDLTSIDCRISVAEIYAGLEIFS